MVVAGSLFALSCRAQVQFVDLTIAAGPMNVPITRCADEILKRQTSDGAIVMGGIQSTSNVSPYFANLGAIGLAKAAQETGNRRYLFAAEHWFDWYAAHMNPNGTVYDYTGSPAAWRPTGDFDSTDSYAATALELLDFSNARTSPGPLPAIPQRLAQSPPSALLCKQMV